MLRKFASRRIPNGLLPMPYLLGKHFSTSRNKLSQAIEDVKQEIKIENANTTKQEQDEEIGIETFAKVNLIVGTIIKFEHVPKSKKLLKFEVDCGSAYGVRTIVSGIKQYYDNPETQLLNRKVVVVANLQRKTMAGMLYLLSNIIIFNRHSKSWHALVCRRYKQQQIGTCYC